MLGTESGTRFEVELPAAWPPCPTCGCERRIAVAFARRRRVAVYCGGPHPHRLTWADGTGRERPWIAGEAFAAGGEFAGAIPPRFFDPASGGAPRAYAIGERRKEWIFNEQPACAACGAPTLREWADGAKLLDWLRAYHAREFDAVLEHAGAAGRRLTPENWYADAARTNLDLIARINFLIEDGALHAAHSIPAAVLAARWPSWPPQLRRLAANTLAFGFCRRCHDGGRIETTARDELIRRHVTFNHCASPAAARADGATWAALMRLVHAVDDDRQA